MSLVELNEKIVELYVLYKHKIITLEELEEYRLNIGVNNNDI